jgi:predicted GNAT family acetyltransferase
MGASRPRENRYQRIAAGQYGFAMHLEFHDDAATFLEVAGEHLAADPVLSTVIATVTRRAVNGVDLARGTGPRWWLVVREGSRVVSVAMRTAPAPPHPIYVMPMPDAAALALARALHERGEQLLGINGAMPAAQIVAEETARLSGGEAQVAERTRLHAVSSVVPARPTPGRLRLAKPDDLDLVLRWFLAFDADAAEQAGRDGEHQMLEPPEEEALLPRIEQGRVWLWDDEHGETVHLTAANPPAYGVTRIGPVYTPRERRGHGYARAAVAEVSQLLLDDGLRVCLFTDLDNPTSNRVYEAVGYRPVVDMANLVVTTPEPA